MIMSYNVGPFFVKGLTGPISRVETHAHGKGRIINFRQLLTLPMVCLSLSVVLAALAAVLTAAIIANPEHSQDLAVMN